jgi:pyruvate/2-oxoglutarate dehydrogenase complex dihydrolipoamide dehydrogenase (E3) component
LQASVASHKSDLLPLLDHLCAQVEKLPIRVVNADADAQELARGGYEVVVVAVGAAPRRLELPGPLPVLPALDVLNGDLPVAEAAAVVVVGGGFVGAETALHLAETGRRVTIVESEAELMAGDVFTDRITYADLLAERGVEVYTRTNATGTAEGAAVVKSDGAERTIAGDVAVAAVGSDAQGELVDALTAATPDLEVHVIGDCLGTGKLYDALHQAYQTARRI